MARYFYLNRPPMYGTQPDGFAAQAGGLPARLWDTADGKQISAFGWVEYTDPLRLDVIWKWDLWPDDPTEAAHYHFWQHANRDPDFAQALEDDYVTTWLNDPATFTTYQSQQMIDMVRLLAAERNLS